jgi:hypothetical protein
MAVNDCVHSGLLRQGIGRSFNEGGHEAQLDSMPFSEGILIILAELHNCTEGENY